MVESLGAGTAYSPSPPVTGNHSAPVSPPPPKPPTPPPPMPPPPEPTDIPHPALLSCRPPQRDRKSTRLNSSHQISSYAGFRVQKKNRSEPRPAHRQPHRIAAR